MEELTTHQINIIALVVIYLAVMFALIWRMTNPKCQKQRIKERKRQIRKYKKQNNRK